MWLALRMTALLAATLAIVLIAAACCPDDRGPAQTGAIAGSVTRDGGASAGARIKAVLDTFGPPGTSGLSHTGIADSAGVFRLDGLPVGRYIVSAASGPRCAIRPGVNVMPNGTTQVALDLVPTGSLGGVLTLGGSASAKAASGNAGATVWVAGTSFSAVTTDSGEYTIAGIPVGSAYTVMATRAGYTVATAGGLAVSAGSTTAVPAMEIAPTDNQSPQITTLAATPASVPAGMASRLDVSASDIDGDALTYAWSAGEGTLSSPPTGSSVRWTAPPTGGFYIVTVVVSDGRGGAAAGAVAVEVTAETPNRAPVITEMTPNNTPDVEKGQSIAVAATAADPDGDDLTYLWSSTGGTLTGGGATVTWTAPQLAGTYAISCIVSDGRGGMAQASIAVTVTDMNIVIW